MAAVQLVGEHQDRFLPRRAARGRAAAGAYLGPRLAGLAAHGLAQLVEGAGLDLSHALSADPEVAAQSLQRLRFFGAACAA